MISRLFSSKPRPVASPVASPAHNKLSPSPSTGTPPPHHSESMTPAPVPKEPLAMDIDVPATRDALVDLLEAVPPKTLHLYLLERLKQTTSTPLEPHTLAQLKVAFAELTPPPVLHCVRCHKNYVEIENGERACVMEHDDESTEVEHVKSLGLRTTWGCCGETVEGEGDSGPPAGWCYEGTHTTDRLRARYRKDRTEEDDKLQSCQTLRCAKRQERAAKRGRTSIDSADTSVEVEAGKVPAKRKRKPARTSLDGTPTTVEKVVRKRGRPAAMEEGDDNDSERARSATPVTPAPKGKRGPKPRSAISTPKSVDEPVKPPSKRRKVAVAAAA